jgi:hypothetical protein
MPPTWEMEKGGPQFKASPRQELAGPYIKVAMLSVMVHICIPSCLGDGGRIDVLSPRPYLKSKLKPKRAGGMA